MCELRIGIDIAEHGKLHLLIYLSYFNIISVKRKVHHNLPEMFQSGSDGPTDIAISRATR